MEKNLKQKKVLCDICNTKIGLDKFDDHFSTHGLNVYEYFWKLNPHSTTEKTILYKISKIKRIKKKINQVLDMIISIQL